MKKILFFSFAVLMTMMASAKPVDPDRAVQVAKNYMAQYVKGADQMTATVVYTHPMPKSGRPAMYVVNVGNRFVLVSADDIAHPVLGYSLSRPWPTATKGEKVSLPSQVSGYLDDLAAQIESAIGQQGASDSETATEWNQLLTRNTLPQDANTLESIDESEQLLTTNLPDSVGPLLTTTWDQGQYYNALCPEDANGFAGHVPTGCVATAMAQIINYWGYPVHGRGIHSYNSPYGTLTVNYDSANYDYANMPTALTATSTPAQVNAVATLMRDCGVAANMMYGPFESGSYNHDACAGLINYFRYSPDVKIIWRSMYDNNEWEVLVAHSLERREPIYYSGRRRVDGAGHAWVIDGYNENGLFHFNFGWGGAADGWYLLSAGNDYVFTIDQLAIVNLRQDSSANSIVGYNGKDEYVVTDFMDFNNIFGPTPFFQNLGFRFDTITFVPDDSTSQLVLDVMDFYNGDIWVYDGINTDSLLRTFIVDRLGHNIQSRDRTPIVSTQKAITIVYNRLNHEGFHFRISKETSCRMVSNIEVLTSPTSINVTWTENGSSTLWEVEYGFNGYLRGEGEVDTVSTNSITLTNIEQDSTYELYIRPICGSSEVINSIVVNNRIYWTDIVNSEPAGYSVDANGIIHISSPEGLAWLSKLSWEMGESYFSLDRNTISIESNLDLSGHLWKPINGWLGNFAGNAHIINNMTVDGEGQGGLFRAFDGDTIKDIGFIGASIKASQIGVISDWSGYNCHAINCFSQGHRLMGVGVQTGGLFGEFNGVMVNCFASGSLSSSYYQGGIIGVGAPDLYNCYSSVTSFFDPSYTFNSGLICSVTTGGSFENCFADIDYEQNTWSSFNAGSTYDEDNTVIGYFFGYAENINTIQNVSGFSRRGNTFAHLVPDTAVNYQYNGSVDLVTALNQGVMEYNSPLLRTWLWDSVSGLPTFGEYYQVTCPNVSIISASNIMYNNNYAVALSWQENGTAEEWQIKCVPITLPEDSTVFFHAYTTHDTLQGLSLGETYIIYVRSICENGNQNSWGQPIIFLVDMPYWDEVISSQPEGYVEDGNGNVNIYSAEGLTWLAICSNGLYGQNRNDYMGRRIRIMSDIDLNGLKWRPISRTNNYRNSFSDSYQIERSFKGIIDGNGHSISNMYCNEDFGDEEYNTYCVGLISYATNAIISDLYLSNCFVKGRVTVGSLTGIARDCLISNCHVNGQVFGIQSIGGLAGCLKTSDEGNECKVINSSSTGHVYGDYGAGGFIGTMEYFTMTINSYSSTDIFRYSDLNVEKLGGLVGMYYGNILNCYHIGEIASSDITQSGYTLDTSSIPNVGVLQPPIAIGDSIYTDLLSVLNAWVDAYDTAGVYRHWAADSTGVNGGFPVFAYIPCTPTTGGDSIVVCDSYTWHNTLFTESTTLTDTLTNIDGCDSIVMHHLIVNHPVHTATNETVCESYAWNGTDYTASGDYTYIHLDANNCMQVDTLHLTINTPVHTATTQVACEAYTWTTGSGTTYTDGGDYTYAHADNNGCTQVDTLHLIINNPVHTATTEVVCDSYTWQGTPFTASGTYTYPHDDVNGCTQVDTLHLTVNYSVTTTVTDSSDGSYTWNGTIYTESGTYQWHGTTAEGCDSTVTLVLVINQVGIEDLDSQLQVTLYPNPTTGLLTIDAEDVLSIEVFDLTGRRMAIHERIHTIDLRGLLAGSYLLKIHYPGGTSLQRVILK